MPAKSETSEERRAYKREWEKANRRGKLHKVWMGIFYEDSSEGWRDEAEELGLPFCVSPLHDQDVWTKTDERKNPAHVAGELKEPHRHFLVEYPHAVDYETVKEDFAFLSGGKHIKFAKSKASMALYLCHIGSEDKALYDAAEVLEFGGANWREWCSELEDIHAVMREMRIWLNANPDVHEWEFSDFVDWCDENNDEWSRALDLKCAWAISHYMDKRRNKLAAKHRVQRAAVAERTDDEPWMDDYACWCEVSGTTPPTRTNTHQYGREDGASCPICDSQDLTKWGKTAGGTQRFKCKECGKVFTDRDDFLVVL